MPAAIIIVLTVYFTMREAAKARRNILFGVTLSKELLESENIKNIVNEFKKKMNLYCLLGVILIPFLVSILMLDFSKPKL